MLSQIRSYLIDIIMASSAWFIVMGIIIYFNGDVLSLSRFAMLSLMFGFLLICSIRLPISLFNQIKKSLISLNS
jgi:hypothetical protein